MLFSTGLVALIILGGYFFFFFLFPVLMIGAPTPLYGTYNFGTEPHTLSIKVLDATNKTLICRTYLVQPDADIEYPRGIGWYPTITLAPFTWSEGTYTFIATLDNNTTVSHTTAVQITQTVSIDIDFFETPLEIKEIWV